MIRPLTDVVPGRRVRLMSVNAGCRQQCRLADMGLLPGMEIEVISNIDDRPLVLNVNDGRLVICRNIARKMTVLVPQNGDSPKPFDMNHPAAGTNGTPVCLRRMAVNQRGVIRSVKAEGELGRRIRDMGLVPNTEIKVVGRAPLKDPVALRLRDFTLSLRNNEADHIMVSVLGDPVEQANYDCTCG